jgi:hypothetical protein
MEKCNHYNHKVVGFRRIRRSDGKVREFNVHWCPFCGAIIIGDRWIGPVQFTPDEDDGVIGEDGLNDQAGSISIDE